MYRYILSLLVIPLICALLQACNAEPRVTSKSSISNSAQMNTELGKLFMAKNKLTPGIHTLPSGLQYSVVKYGYGDRPKLNDLVTLFYQGQFINGHVFDDEHAQKNPVTIRVSATIPGFQEALQLMPPGSIWVLYVPAQLAYGERGILGRVGPNETLVYRVHLLAKKI